ncbi:MULTISPECIES: hypothetical protein [unclassified Sedimentibacter]|uniref:hypothetical protein n=1 Tax=unclassified Sedimentibacter TaxID=2649220 RepID=UPI0027E1327E|nr:hypothetical protein [Sedimentibacter sp. MB35-C1]WMJ77555.1 hypothetical protein RBQ61_01100 [Sedimentibacter sp. MB35-C1]
MDISWDEITQEELKYLYYDEELTDRQIADIFGVTIGKVTYKRKKFDINIKNKVYQEFMNQNSDLLKEANSNSKERLLKRENIDSISKAITHFVFRNGPVEDMHANNQLSEVDMKTLNKFMVNRIAGLLTAIADNKWLQLELLLSYYKLFGTEWDKAEPDMKEINLAMKLLLIDRL